MTEKIRIGGLSIAPTLHHLIEREIAPGTGISTSQFWAELEAIVADLGPVNARLLERRDVLQEQIDAWHRANPGRPDAATYRVFLESIGYLIPERDDFTITTQNVDSEIAEQNGPQLVVPVKNARFALNAANARWGSLYDAL